MFSAAFVMYSAIPPPPRLFSAMPVLRDGGVPFAPRKPGAGTSAPQLVSDSRRERKQSIFLKTFKSNFINQAITTFQIRHLIRFETTFIILTKC
jgi:hypothetical protein